MNPDAWTVSVVVPPYDLATHKRLAELRVYLVPSGHGQPTDGPGYVASS